MSKERSAHWKKGQLWCKSKAVKLWSGSNEVQIVTCCSFILKNWKQQLINSKLETDVPVTEGLKTEKAKAK